jgi:4-hydroxy-tetrahydrodipicolinate synthase
MVDYARARDELRGLVLNLTVPFRAGDYAVDHEGLRRNLEFYVAHGIRVIMLTAGTSSFACMTEAEIAAVTRTVVETVAGRAHVMACTGTWWLGQTLEFAAYCEQLGADSLMVIKHEPPNAGPEDYYAFHAAVARATRLPLVYHHFLTGAKAAAVVRRVAELPSVVASKHDTDDYQAFSLMRDAVGDRWSVISPGGSELALIGHFFGAAGSLTGIGQWAPEPELAYVADCLAGRWDSAHAYLRRVLPFRRLAGSINNHLAIKHLMDVVGLAGGPQRPLFMVPLTPAQQQQLTEAAAAAGLLGARS